MEQMIVARGRIAQLACAILIGMGVTVLADSKYAGPISGTSPASPVNFSDPENWSPKGVPTGSGANASFDPAVMGTLTEPLYVRLPDTLSIKTLSAGGAKVNVFLGKSVIPASISYITYGYPSSWTYADEICASDGYVAAGLAGPVGGKTLSASAGYVYWDHSRYAISDSETIVDPITTGTWIEGSATLSLTAPRPCQQVKGLWKLTKESPYASFVGSDIHVVSPGAKVTDAAGLLPQGTYVRRWFPESRMIELSNAASGDAVSDEITFAAYNPSLTQSLGTYRHQGSGNGNKLILNKWTEDQSVVLEIDTLEAWTAESFACDAGKYPWRVVLHDIPCTKDFTLWDADIEIGLPKTATYNRGFALCTVNVGASATAKVTVDAGDPALFGGFAGVGTDGKLVKLGAGTLGVALSDDSAGTIDVSGGTLTVRQKEGVTRCCSLGTVVVRSGATLNLAGLVVAADSVTVEEGGAVTGSGEIVFSSAAAAEAFSAPDGIAIGVAGSGTVGGLRLGANGCVDIAEGITLEVIGKVDGTGMLTKTGPGTLLLGEFSRSSDAIVVSDGKLTLMSKVPDKSNVPVMAGHFDTMGDYGVVNTGTWGGYTWLNDWASAPDADGIQLKMYSHGTQAKMKVVSGSSIAAMNGKTVVDFGEQMFDNSAIGALQKASTSLWMYKPGDGKIESGFKAVFWMIGSAAGGGTLLGDDVSYRGYNDSNACGIMRGGKFSDGDFSEGASAPMTKKAYPTRTFRLNGKEVDPQTTGFSGTYDVVTMIAPEGVGIDCFGGKIHYAWFSGGQEIGEIILSRDDLTPMQIRDVEAYLQKKWFNVTPPGYVQAAAGAVRVAPGAELEVVGALGLEISQVSGGGTLSGTIRAAGPLQLSLTAADGAIAPLTLNCDELDLSQGGVISVTGDLDTLPVGETDLVVSPAIHVGQAWTLVAHGRRRVLTVKVCEGKVRASVTKAGLTVILR